MRDSGLEASVTPYDLVLMDLRMPEMDGIETSKRITAEKDLFPLPLIIMVSAFGREEIIKQAKGMGIKTFLMKPVNLHLLYDTIMNTFGEDADDSYASSAAKVAENTDIGLDGLRILLAEDNVMNQEVAAEILTSAGIIVEIANNGEEAVEAVTNLAFDLVLMDIQMPVMGGFEATKHIRSIDQFKELPIIAMTAHAMQGAREDCLAAGMNDYVSKPIDPPVLFSTIRKWLKPGTAIGKSKSEKEAVHIIDSSAYISLPKYIPGVDIEAGLKRLNGNRKLYKKLLFEFSAGYTSVSDDIRKHMEQGDTEPALRLAHTIKGVAGNISANEIQKIAAVLEEALMRSDEKEAMRLLPELDRALRSIDDSLTGFPLLPGAKILQNEKTVDAAKAEPLLQRLATLILENNVNAGKAFEELQTYIGPAAYGKEMKELAMYIDDYDFDAAKAAIQKLTNAMGIVPGGFET